MSAWNPHIAGYLTEVFFHSLITIMVVEVLIYSWRINRPGSRLRFRSLALVFPVFLPLFYKFLHPLWKEGFFRENAAIFSGLPWLRLRVLGGITLWQVSIIIMGATTLMFVLQELLPLISGGVGNHSSKRKPKPDEQQMLEAALNSFGKNPGLRKGDRLDIYILEDRLPILCTRGLRRPSLLVSDSLLGLLDEEELKGALAHELVHIANNDRLKAWILFFMRALMFYNPVALVVFRAIINENERICDDAAVETTGNPLAFASGLIKVYKANLSLQNRKAARPVGGWLHSMASSIEDNSHKVRVVQRVRRLLREERPEAVTYEYFRLGFLAGSLMVLLFFVV